MLLLNETWCCFVATCCRMRARGVTRVDSIVRIVATRTIRPVTTNERCREDVYLAPGKRSSPPPPPEASTCFCCSAVNQRSCPSAITDFGPVLHYFQWFKLTASRRLYKPSITSSLSRIARRNSLDRSLSHCFYHSLSRCTPPTSLTSRSGPQAMA